MGEHIIDLTVTLGGPGTLVEANELASFLRVAIEELGERPGTFQNRILGVQINHVEALAEAYAVDVELGKVAGFKPRVLPGGWSDRDRHFTQQFDPAA